MRHPVVRDCGFILTTSHLIAKHSLPHPIHCELRLQDPSAPAVTLSKPRHADHTETGSTGFALPVHGGSPVASTSCARMEERSDIFGNDAWNATGTGGKGQQELPGACSNVSSKQGALHGHANEHTGDRAHTCRASDSVTNSEFVKHCWNTKGKNHKCASCDKIFRRADHLAAHCRTHTNERPYKCEMCDKSFRQSYQRDVHKRTHTGDRPYKCEICEKSFRRSHHRDDHKRTHTNERPYNCKICDKSFRQSNHLDNHMRTHPGEKPYTCRTCSKSFTRLATLRVHQTTHTDETPRLSNM
ncbi:uncharacterized protein [Dermacentor andersoni]|uniref:uncharacterized protein n=1 Tax=Dermacentor andersoni TaxID=34620 RepID=UPI003B3A0571